MVKKVRTFLGAPWISTTFQRIALDYSRDISELANKEKDPCLDSVITRVISTLIYRSDSHYDWPWPHSMHNNVMQAAVAGAGSYQD